MAYLNTIDLDILPQLADREFRREWFRAELEASVPEQYRSLRERREMTQGQLAAEAGMLQPAVSRFERSSTAKWEFDTLLRLAEALDARLRVVVEASEDVIAEYTLDNTWRPGPLSSNSERTYVSATPLGDFTDIEPRKPQAPVPPQGVVSALIDREHSRPARLLSA